MWVYRSNINDDHPIILFDYHKTRKTDCLREFVNGFHGVIVSDGYASYHQLEKEMPESITSAGCWVHVRRNFFNIIKAAGGKDRKKAKYTLAEEGVQRIAKITHRDKELLKIPEETRKEEDIQALREATESFFAWAQQHLNEVPGGSNIGKAFKYALNRKKSLEVIPQHLEDTNLDFLDDLLPWSEEVQKRCRSNLEKEKTEN
ncbi:MAG: transposase [Eubacterium sp.]|jgi:hypothetical protein|nr:transposase [Eubacterium sp.]MCI2197266.1 transposase [Eubacterium sp.]